MQGETRERWQELCEQAANEQGPTKTLELVEEINRLLAIKYDRLSYADGAPPKTSKESSTLAGRHEEFAEAKRRTEQIDAKCLLPV
jgi:hypothetical protein